MKRSAPSQEAVRAYRLAKLALTVALGAIAYCTTHGALS